MNNGEVIKKINRSYNSGDLFKVSDDLSMPIYPMGENCTTCVQFNRCFGPVTDGNVVHYEFNRQTDANEIRVVLHFGEGGVDPRVIVRLESELDETIGMRGSGEDLRRCRHSVIVGTDVNCDDLSFEQIMCELKGKLRRLHSVCGCVLESAERITK